jgi:hypothetical protein
MSVWIGLIQSYVRIFEAISTSIHHGRITNWIADLDHPGWLKPQRMTVLFFSIFFRRVKIEFYDPLGEDRLVDVHIQSSGESS